MSDLPHRLDRTIVIRASRETVFRFFTEPALWAAWWGVGSTVGAAAGDALTIVHPGNVKAGGTIVDIAPPERLVFTYGYESGRPMPIGASHVTITLEPEADGTRVRLTHELPTAAARDEHIQGWRYQLSLFANVVSNELHRDAAARVDAWFAAWSDADRDARTSALAAVATPAVSFRDRYSNIETLAELTEHIGAYHMQMPKLRLSRVGEPRHCQGTVLADWVMAGADGQVRARGTNVFTLTSDGRIEAVTGLWAPAAHP